MECVSFSGVLFANLITVLSFLLGWSIADYLRKRK